MTYEQTDKLLKFFGWDLECWEPLEICCSFDGGRATESAARILIEMMKEMKFGGEAKPPGSIDRNILTLKKGAKPYET